MKSSLTSLVISNEYLAAPDSAVFAVARAIECHADHRIGAIMAILSHTSRNVSVMVLHTDREDILTLRTFQCIACSQIVRMQIVGQGFGCYSEQPLEMFYTLFEG